MISRLVRYEDLGISLSDIYEQMGYGTSIPDDMTVAETSAMLERISRILRPQFCFFITDAVLDTEAKTLSVMGHDFSIGHIIAAQLRGSIRFAFFVATAGKEFEEFQHSLTAEGDMVKIFIADAIGSVIAEKVADLMEKELELLLDRSGWHHTNRFSPGYCGWHVSAQHDLFSLFPTPAPCGVTLTESSLMTPIKSVSGVIGLGDKVRKLEYSCGLCDYKLCYKRRLPTKN